ncbi:HD domain-containing protein [Streptomyces jumonjinensis]|nr:HD domain-containing protein [Streptomyces jumonjinensis]
MTEGSASMPLVELAKQRRLPAHQFMDAATVTWIEINRPEPANISPTTLPPELSLLIRRSALPVDWLADHRLYDSLHGVRHSMRTAALTALLARFLEWGEEDTAVAVVAAALHDCRRLDDRGDPGHGARSALWATEHAPAVWHHFGIEPTGPRITRAAAAIRLHEVPYDGFGPADLAEYASARAICDLLKAADALDRYRLPKLGWWPDMRHVRVPAFRRFRGIAFDLVLHSEAAHVAGAGSAEAVLGALVEKGVILP